MQEKQPFGNKVKALSFYIVFKHFINVLKNTSYAYFGHSDFLQHSVKRTLLNHRS